MADKPGNQTPNTPDVSETDDVGAGPDGGKPDGQQSNFFRLESPHREDA